MFLLVVEDRHAERELRLALAGARERGEGAAVLTADALLAMRLRRDGVAVRLTIYRYSTDAGAARDPGAMARLDRAALDGVAAAFGERARADGRDFGPYLQYTLIPIFIRAIRNVAAVDDAIGTPEAVMKRVVLVGGGALVDAARLVAERRGVAIETAGGGAATRAAHAVDRLLAGRATRWVNTAFRALVLEPGFLWLLFVRGFLRALVSPARKTAARRAIIVVGDRFTADVIERVRGDARPIVLAGATQPGRALFDGGSRGADLTPIEAFTRPSDLLQWIAAKFDAMGQALALHGDAAHARQFTFNGIPWWPLVSRTTCWHLVMWLPALRHLQALTARAAQVHEGAQLLTSSDVTAYNRVLIDTARAFGVTSIGIQHGITGEPNGHTMVHVDQLATWGPQAEAWYTEHAAELGLRQTAGFTVTGNPRFDSLAHRQLAPSPQPPAPFTVTVCTGFMSDFSTGASEYENLLMLDAVIAWAGPQTGVHVIHKMHPGEEPEYYAAAARALGWDAARVETIREPILYDVLERSSVLVAAYSTTVLESIALGAPAIVVDAIVKRRLLPLDRIPGISIAYTVDELRAQLDARKAAQPTDRQSLRATPELREYISELDGHATERVAALLGSGEIGGDQRGDS